MSEEHFASIYDYLMAEAPYEQWLEYAEGNLPKQAKIVDVACGTGTLAMGLQQLGYKVTGVDISQEMLTIAENKFRKNNVNIPLFQQDMRELSGFTDFDGVTMFCDGLNYLLDDQDVRRTFQRVSESLKTGGVFLFDVHSTYKMEEIFNDQMYGENGEDVSYMWFCTPGEGPYSVEHTLTFFLNTSEGNKYERMDETHFQRTFLISDYLNWLKLSGFERIEVTSNFGKSEVSETDERIFFKAIKK